MSPAAPADAAAKAPAALPPPGAAAKPPAAKELEGLTTAQAGWGWGALPLAGSLLASARVCCAEQLPAAERPAAAGSMECTCTEPLP